MPEEDEASSNYKIVFEDIRDAAVLPPSMACFFLSFISQSVDFQSHML